MPTNGLSDRSVSVAIRPEGFILSNSGVLTCELNRVEVMGRDVSVVCIHNACENPSIRAIISSDIPVDTTSTMVRFNIKPQKIFLFDKETQKRLFWDSQE